MRLIDDKIVYAINQTIPTASFKGQTNPEQNCKELYEKVRIYFYPSTAKYKLWLKPIWFELAYFQCPWYISDQYF